MGSRGDSSGPGVQEIVLQGSMLRVMMVLGIVGCSGYPLENSAIDGVKRILRTLLSNANRIACKSPETYVFRLEIDMGGS